MCSSDVCRDKTTFASTFFFVDHLRVDDTSLSVAQLQNRSITRYKNTIWIKTDVNFYTVSYINVEKKFEEFLAEIGGNFGLFAGASILTLVEFGEFFADIFKRIADRQSGCKKKVIATNRQNDKTCNCYKMTK